MGQLRIEGGKRLYGKMPVHGSKNSILPVLAATIINSGKSIIHNCPRLKDVYSSVKILRHLGCKAEWQGDTLYVDSENFCCDDIPDGLMREMRSSIVFLGAIAVRAGSCSISMPGGCELGPRPVDIHISALRALGAEIQEEYGHICCVNTGFKGCDITLPFPSVGATENTMIAACMAKGITHIINAAREPEIIDLQHFLCRMGARVYGAGSSVITVEGGYRLTDAEYTVKPDRIVAGTYMCAVAGAGGDVFITVAECDRIYPLAGVLAECGCRIDWEKTGVRIRRIGRLKAPVHAVKTMPYPGFPTDAQPPLLAAMCCAQGSSIFVENIFSNRYRFTSELERMGADIHIEGRAAFVRGVEKLYPAEVEATDLRGGAALIVAALATEGITTIRKTLLKQTNLLLIKFFI